MVRKSDLTAVELEIMKAVWEITEDEGSIANTSSIRRKISEWRGEKVYGQSIYSYFSMLEEKGLIRSEQEKNGRRMIIPLISRDRYIERQAKFWARFWNKSSAGYAIMALNNDDKPTEEEKEILRRLIDELD